MHYTAEAATVLQWSRLSDHIGRKPILLMSLLGSVISTILFGLSRSFWTLILRYGSPLPFLSYKMDDHLQYIVPPNDSRLLNGMVNGNVGVIKSMIAELTDESNVARGFTLIPMACSVGYIMGFVGRVYCCCDVVIDVLRTRVLQSVHRRCFITSARSMA